jgi:hypothetical protein
LNRFDLAFLQAHKAVNLAAEEGCVDAAAIVAQPPQKRLQCVCLNGLGSAFLQARTVVDLAAEAGGVAAAALMC